MAGSEDRNMPTSEVERDGQLPSQMDVESQSDRHLRQAFLASQRDDLLAPVHAIVEVCERLLSDAKTQYPDEFVSDLQLMQSSGHDLQLLIEDILSESSLQLASVEGDLDSIQIGRASCRERV